MTWDPLQLYARRSLKCWDGPRSHACKVWAQPFELVLQPLIVSLACSCPSGPFSESLCPASAEKIRERGENPLGNLSKLGVWVVVLFCFSFYLPYHSLARVLLPSMEPSTDLGSDNHPSFPLCPSFWSYQLLSIPLQTLLGPSALLCPRNGHCSDTMVSAGSWVSSQLACNPCPTYRHLPACQDATTL